MHSALILTLLALLVRQVHLFSWDIVVGGTTRLEFYYNETITHTEDILPAYRIQSVTYDPVHYRVLFAALNRPNTSIFSFDISTRKIQPLVTRTTNSMRAVYEVVTQVLYWKETFSIHSFPLDSASSNKSVDVNLLALLDHKCRDVAVDSCGGYIYWITDYEIERARLNGSEREVLIKSSVWWRISLAIDQQTQKIYWIETIHSRDNQVSIKSANFSGKERTTLYIVKDTSYALSLAVSKDFIYWQNYDQEGIWKLRKKPTQQLARKLNSTPTLCAICHRIAAKYTIKEQIEGIKSCHALQGLIPYNSSESASSICQNYCFEGECSVSAEGQPTCSCKVGYSGKRCEVNKCNNFCLNNGVCSLNEEDEPVCECTAEYGSERCDVPITHTDDHADNMAQQVLRDLRSEVRQVIKEELKGILQFFSNKFVEYKTKI